MREDRKRGGREAGTTEEDDQNKPRESIFGHLQVGWKCDSTRNGSFGSARGGVQRDGGKKAIGLNFMSIIPHFLFFFMFLSVCDTGWLLATFLFSGYPSGCPLPATSTHGGLIT